MVLLYQTNVCHQVALKVASHVCSLSRMMGRRVTVPNAVTLTTITKEPGAQQKLIKMDFMLVDITPTATDRHVTQVSDFV